MSGMEGLFVRGSNATNEWGGCLEVRKMYHISKSIEVSPGTSILTSLILLARICGAAI
jgi:hypothetical protein